MLGRVLDEELHDPDKAIDAYASALRAGDQRAPTLAALARLYEQRTMWRQAAETLDRSAEVARDAPARAAALFRAGGLYAEKLGEREAAEDRYTRALAAVPDDPATLEALAGIYRGKGETARAANTYVDAATLAPGPSHKSRLLTEAGILFQDDLDDRARAQTLFAQALVSDPEDRRAGERLVPIYLESGRFAEAEPLLQMLLRHAAAGETGSVEDGARARGRRREPPGVRGAQAGQAGSGGRRLRARAGAGADVAAGAGRSRRSAARTAGLARGRASLPQPARPPRGGAAGEGAARGLRAPRARHHRARRSRGGARLLREGVGAGRAEPDRARGDREPARRRGRLCGAGAGQARVARAGRRRRQGAALRGDRPDLSRQAAQPAAGDRRLSVGAGDRSRAAPDAAQAAGAIHQRAAVGPGRRHAGAARRAGDGARRPRQVPVHGGADPARRAQRRRGRGRVAQPRARGGAHRRPRRSTRSSGR